MKKEVKFKLIIVLFNAALLFGGTFALFWYDIVSFDWSRALEKDYQYSQSKKKDKRILIIGDSQLEEHIAVRSLHKLIESFCRENEIGFANAAHYGFGPIEYLDQAKKYIPDYKPDLIIIFYNAFNDLTDVMNRHEGQGVKESHDIFILDPDSSVTYVDSQIEDSIAIASIDSEPEKPAMATLRNPDDFDWDEFYRKGIDPALIQQAKEGLSKSFTRSEGIINPHLLVTAVWQPEYLRYNLSVDEAHSRFAWYRTTKLFQKVFELAGHHGSRVAIMVIPSTLQIDDSHYEFFRRLNMFVDSSWMKQSTPQLLVKRMCRASNAILIDPLENFRNRELDSIYYLNDDHLNDNGQNALFEYLKSTLLMSYQKGNMDSLGLVVPIDHYKEYNQWKRDFYTRRFLDRIDLNY
ncbi:MAG: hypothetical protein RIE58_02715 [Vicingaceae bacterium]